MLKVLELFAENWYLIVTCVCAIILSIMKIVEFIGYPTAKKKEEIKERLLAFVTEAELELGGGTGRLKLATVYEYFAETFPHVKKWISLEEFSDLVNEVLPTMREILEGNLEKSDI